MPFHLTMDTRITVWSFILTAHNGGSLSDHGRALRRALLYECRYIRYGACECIRQPLYPSASPCGCMNLGSQRQNSPRLLPLPPASPEHSGVSKPIARSCQNTAPPLPSYDSVRTGRGRTLPPFSPLPPAASAQRVS